jgi:hypothetical protein
MKKFVLAASAALLMAGMSVAVAQTTKSEKPNVPPQSINKGSDQVNARTSGTEPKAAAKTTRTHATKKAQTKHLQKKQKAAVSPANINKGTDESSTGTSTSGSQPNSTAKPR